MKQLTLYGEWLITKYRWRMERAKLSEGQYTYLCGLICRRFRSAVAS